MLSSLVAALAASPCGPAIRSAVAVLAKFVEPRAHRNSLVDVW